MNNKQAAADAMAIAEALDQLDKIYTPTKAFRWLDRGGVRILQQKWECAARVIGSIFENMLTGKPIEESTHEWRDVPVVIE